jgi:hypothetical protein
LTVIANLLPAIADEGHISNLKHKTMNYCPQCGSEVIEGVKFCASCGYQIVSQQEAPPPVTPETEPLKHTQEPVYEQASSAFTNAVTGKTNLVQRVINILTKPKQEWVVIDAEQPNTINLLVGYALVLALIPAIAVFIKYGIIGTTLWGDTHRNLGTGIMHALIQLIGAGVGVYLFAWVIDLLAPSFESGKNMGKSLQLSTYANTPIWVLGILNLFGTLGSLVVFLGAIYSIYLLYIGIPIIKKTPPEKVTGYLVISIIALLVIYFVVAMILGVILGLFFVTGGGMRGF